MLIKKDNKCFHSVTAASNHEEIKKKNSQKIPKTKAFINKYNWEEITYLSQKDVQKKFQKNQGAIALNVLYAKKEKIYPTYVSKHNSNHEKQVTLLMILNGEGWHYLTLKMLSAVLRGITSKNNGDMV